MRFTRIHRIHHQHELFEARHTNTYAIGNEKTYSEDSVDSFNGFNDQDEEANKFLRRRRRRHGTMIPHDRSSRGDMYLVLPLEV